MLTLILPRDITDRMIIALKAAGHREIGGIIMAEHTGYNTFQVREITIHGRGAVASFVRRIGKAVADLRAFFRTTEHDYRRFNYLGEWHSHPLFSVYPSITDDNSMLEIVQDPSVGALFATLLIVKLDVENHLVVTAHTYLPDGSKSRSIVEIE